MTTKARQLVLDLPHRPAQGRDDFLVTPSNAAAVQMIDRWPEWPSNAMVLAGPPGSGKSHLTEVWRQKSGASRVGANDLRVGEVPRLLAGGALAVEDAPGLKLDEAALFHLLNAAREARASLLMTSRTHPGAWQVRLPDLVSRLRALPVTEIGLPDDALLRGVLVKLFADRQLAVEETAVSYALMRMPRSLDAARGLVAEIDRQSLEAKREVTRSFVAQVLASHEAPGLFDGEE
jgi:chromosomal replication initiation ATPase DnaA